MRAEFRLSPRAAHAAEEQARRADVDDAVGAAAGFDAGVGEIFEREEEREVFRERARDAEIGDDGFAEDEGILVVLELAADRTHARREGEFSRRAPRGAERGAAARDLGDLFAGEAGATEARRTVASLKSAAALSESAAAACHVAESSIPCVRVRSRLRRWRPRPPAASVPTMGNVPGPRAIVTLPTASWRSFQKAVAARVSLGRREK
jgi:hypothetical protein